MLKYSFSLFLLFLFYTSPAAPLSFTSDTVPYSARLLSQYVRHQSVTGNERMAGLYFSTIARQKGFHVEILNDEPASFNFTASLYPLDSGKPNIVFLNHIDVVPAGGNGDYTYPPFSGTIADGMVWGRGTIDNKGMGVMQLLGMEFFLEIAGVSNLPFNVTMLSVSGEESGGETGARIVVDKFLERLNPVVVYGEGGSGVPGVLHRHSDRELFGISVAFKRSLWLELSLKMNTSGHGAVPPYSYVVKDKIKALQRLSDRNSRIRFSESTRNMFYDLGRIEGGFRGLALRNLRLFRPLVVPAMKRENIIYSLLTNTVTITGINTPENPPNQIPQEITAILDCRLLPETDTEEFIDKIKRLMVNENVEVRVIKEGLNTRPTSPDEFYYYMKEAIHHVYPGSGVIPILSPASNDNNYFRQKGISVYGILPVFMPVHLLETIHNVDERIPIDNLEKGVEVYRELINILIETGFGKTVTEANSK